MKRFLIVYVSLSGHTKWMAEHIAEGLRMSGQMADVKPLPQVRAPEDLAAYDGIVLGSPTYHRDMVLGFKNWLFKAKKANLTCKFAGAFGSHTHSGEAPEQLFSTMEHVFGMDVLGLGPLRMEEKYINTDEGRRDCQLYGKALGERAAAKA